MDGGTATNQAASISHHMVCCAWVQPMGVTWTTRFQFDYVYVAKALLDYSKTLLFVCLFPRKTF